MSSKWPLVTIDALKAPTKGAIAIGPFGSRMKSDSYVETGIPVIRGTNITKGPNFEGEFVHISKEMADTLGSCNVYKDDLVFPHRGAIGEVGIVIRDERYVLSSSLMKLSCNKDLVLPQYLYYFFKSHLGRHELLKNASQVGTPGIGQPLTSLKGIELKLPPLAYQNKVVASLSSLDSKISQNQKINESIEQIAQAIFKSWFVDFDPTKAKIAACEALLAENPTASPEQIAIAEQQAAIQVIAGAGDVIPTEQLQSIADLFPNQFIDSELGEIPYGWEIKALDQIAHYQNGLALQKFRPESGEDFLPVLKIAQLKAGFADGKEVAKASIKKECIVDNGDVIFSWSGSLVVDIWCGGRVALNQHLFKVTSNTYPKWFFYKWTKYHLEEFQRIAADKAVTMGHIKRSHLSEAKCLIPASELIKNKFISSLIDKQVQVRLESKVLSDVRDSLLPRLLAGEFSLAKVDSEHE